MITKEQINEEARALADALLELCQEKRVRPSVAIQGLIIAMAATLHVVLPGNIEEALQLVDHDLRGLLERPPR